MRSAFPCCVAPFRAPIVAAVFPSIWCLQAWVCGAFFCMGALAWVIRIILLAWMTPFTWLQLLLGLRPSSSSSSSHARDGAKTHAASSTNHSPHLHRGGSNSRMLPQQQQLPGCARPNRSSVRSPGNADGPKATGDRPANKQAAAGAGGRLGTGSSKEGTAERLANGGTPAAGSSGGRSGRVRFADGA